MGRRDRLQNPAAEVIHRDKLFGGRYTAHELHVKLAWNNAKCSACGAGPAIRIRVMIALDDMSLETRSAIEIEIALKRVKSVMTVKGWAICASQMFACKSCRMTAEIAAAKGPSYAMVDIDRGPGEDKPIVGVITTLA